MLVFLSSQHDILFACQEFQLCYEVLDHTIPLKFFCRLMPVAAHALLLSAMAAQVEQVADDLIRVVRLGDDGILERHGVVFACGAGDGYALRGHDFQTDEAERLVSAIGQRGVGGGVGGAHELFGQEEAQVVDIRRADAGYGVNALFQRGPVGRHVANAQTDFVGVAQHVRAMRLDAATHKERDRVAAGLEGGNCINRHHTAFIGVEAANFEQEKAARFSLVTDLAQAAHSLMIDRVQMARGNAVGNDERVDAIFPHFVLHIAADGGDRRHVVEAGPVDAVQRHQAVQVPEHEDFLAQAKPVQQVRGANHGLGGLPVLALNDDHLALRHRRAHDLLVNMVWHALVVVVELLLFTIIDAVEVILADPLRPAFEDQLAVDALLHAGLCGIANVNKVGGKALRGQRLAQFGHARPHAARRRIDIRPLKAEQNKYRILWCYSTIQFNHDLLNPHRYKQGRAWPYTVSLPG